MNPFRGYLYSWFSFQYLGLPFRPSLLSLGHKIQDPGCMIYLHHSISGCRSSAQEKTSLIEAKADFYMLTKHTINSCHDFRVAFNTVAWKYRDCEKIEVLIWKTLKNRDCEVLDLFTWNHRVIHSDFNISRSRFFNMTSCEILKSNLPWRTRTFHRRACEELDVFTVLLNIRYFHGKQVPLRLRSFHEIFTLKYRDSRLSPVKL